MGDDTFKSQVLIRPSILLHILKEGYTLLWTDSDMVWLENPLPLLPHVNNSNEVRLWYIAAGKSVRPLKYRGRLRNRTTWSQKSKI